MTPLPDHAPRDVPQLSWIAPMYRTREFVEPFCARAVATSARLGMSCELVLVDDACPQGSGAAAEQLAGTYPVRVIRMPRNVGQDAAIRCGLRACTGEWAVVLDADLQDPPEAVAELWPLTSNGYDAVFADRVGRYESSVRLLTSRGYRRCAEFIGGLPHGAGLFVLLNRTVVQRVTATRAPRISMLAAIAAANGRYTSVRIERDRRTVGDSSYTARLRWSKGVRSLWQIFAARRLRLPL